MLHTSSHTNDSHSHTSHYHNLYWLAWHTQNHPQKLHDPSSGSLRRSAGSHESVPGATRGDDAAVPASAAAAAGSATTPQAVTTPRSEPGAQAAAAGAGASTPGSERAGVGASPSRPGMTPQMSVDDVNPYKEHDTAFAKVDAVRGLRLAHSIRQPVGASKSRADLRSKSRAEVGGISSAAMSETESSMGSTGDDSSDVGDWLDKSDHEAQPTADSDDGSRSKQSRTAEADAVAAQFQDVDIAWERLVSIKRAMDAAAVPAQSQEEFHRALRVANFNRNDCIIKEGDDGDRFYVIVEGSITLTKSISARQARSAPKSKLVCPPGSTQPELVLTVLRTGHYFGERSLMKRDVRNASGWALDGPVQCMCLDKDRFASLVKQSPALHQFMDTLVRRVDERTKARARANVHSARVPSGMASGSGLTINTRKVHTMRKLGAGRTLLNEYALDKVIGQGAFGRVYGATNKLPGERRGGGGVNVPQHVAIKSIDLSRVSRDRVGAAAEIAREVAVMSRLQHPHCLTLFEVLEHDRRKRLYLVVELMQYGALLTENEYNTPLDPDVARVHFREVVLAVEYLHALGVAHRDIKPSNILLNGSVAKLADFGSCEVVNDDQGHVTSIAGTPAFQPPDVLNATGDTEYNAFAADVWAMGITLHTLVAGTPPFIAANAAQLAEVVERGEYKVPVSLQLDPHLQDLIERMLHPDPEQRITLGGIRNHDWLTAEGADPLPMQQLPAARITPEQLAQAIHDQLGVLDAMTERSIGRASVASSATRDRSGLAIPIGAVSVDASVQSGPNGGMPRSPLLVNTNYRSTSPLTPGLLPVGAASVPPAINLADRTSPEPSSAFSAVVRPKPHGGVPAALLRQRVSSQADADLEPTPSPTLEVEFGIVGRRPVTAAAHLERDRSHVSDSMASTGWDQLGSPFPVDATHQRPSPASRRSEAVTPMYSIGRARNVKKAEAARKEREAAAVKANLQRMRRRQLHLLSQYQLEASPEVLDKLLGQKRFAVHASRAALSSMTLFMNTHGAILGGEGERGRGLDQAGWALSRPISGIATPTLTDDSSHTVAHKVTTMDNLLAMQAIPEAEDMDESQEGSHSATARAPHADPAEQAPLAVAHQRRGSAGGLLYAPSGIDRELHPSTASSNAGFAAGTGQPEPEDVTAAAGSRGRLDSALTLGTKGPASPSSAVLGLLPQDTPERRTLTTHLSGFGMPRERTPGTSTAAGSTVTGDTPTPVRGAKARTLTAASNQSWPSTATSATHTTMSSSEAAARRMHRTHDFIMVTADTTTRGAVMAVQKAVWTSRSVTYSLAGPRVHFAETPTDSLSPSVNKSNRVSRGGASTCTQEDDDDADTASIGSHVESLVELEHLEGLPGTSPAPGTGGATLERTDRSGTGSKAGSTRGASTVGTAHSVASNASTLNHGGEAAGSPPNACAHSARLLSKSSMSTGVDVSAGGGGVSDSDDSRSSVSSLSDASELEPLDNVEEFFGKQLDDAEETADPDLEALTSEEEARWAGEWHRLAVHVPHIWQEPNTAVRNAARMRLEQSRMGSLRQQHVAAAAMPLTDEQQADLEQQCSACWPEVRLDACGNAVRGSSGRLTCAPCGQNLDTGVRFGVASCIGKRAMLEDRVVAVPDIAHASAQLLESGGLTARSRDGSDQPVKMSMYAVFDGHGGDRGAELLAQVFPEQLAAHDQFAQQPGVAIIDAALSTDEHVMRHLHHENDFSGATGIVLLVRRGPATTDLELTRTQGEADVTLGTAISRPISPADQAAQEADDVFGVATDVLSDEDADSSKSPSPAVRPSASPALPVSRTNSLTTVQVEPFSGKTSPGRKPLLRRASSLAIQDEPVLSASPGAARPPATSAVEAHRSFHASVPKDERLWLYCGNVGDCRAVLCRAGEAMELSMDHNFKRADEVARVEAAGGWLSKSRLFGVLAVSRAFGDIEHKLLKEQSWGREFHSDPLIAVPEVLFEPVLPVDEFVVLACDGIFDVLSSGQVVRFVRRHLMQHRDPAAAAQALTQKALQHFSIDNVTAVVVALNQL